MTTSTKSEDVEALVFRLIEEDSPASRTEAATMIRLLLAERDHLKRLVVELEAAAEAEAQRYEDYAVRGEDI